jgi:hypothetical protein
MRLSKKNFLSLIKENLKEMAMDFDTQDRPHPDVTSALSTGDTPLKKIPFPQTNRQDQNFQELLASERYRQVISNLRSYTGVNDRLTSNPNMRLYSMMMDAHNRIIQIESQHKNELIELAINTVCEDMGMDRDEINFVVKLASSNEIPTNDFLRDQPNEDNPEEVDPEESDEIRELQGGELELFDNLKNLNLERAKARLMNAIVQGASKKGHYMYHTVEEELRQITGSNQLINLYGVMMSINDTNYWQFGDSLMAQAQSSVAGKVDVIPAKIQSNDQGNEGGGDEGGGDEGGGDNNIDPSKPTIVVHAINFPVLLHELIKGGMKILKLHGQPENKEIFRQVNQLENTLEKEIWDLRLGPAIWERLRDAIPEEVLIDNNKDLQNYLLMNIFSLEPKQFLVFMREILIKSDNGKRLMDNMIDSIKRMFRDEEYESAVEKFRDDLDNITDETDDDDLRDMLGGLGIGLSDED